MPSNSNKIIVYAALIIGLIGSVYILIWAQQIFLPIAFAILFTFLLHPLCRFFEKYMSTNFSVISIMFLISIIFGGVLYFFVDQFISIFSGLEKVAGDLKNIYNTSLKWIAEQTQTSKSESQIFLKNKLLSSADKPLKLVGQGLMKTTSVLTNFIFIAIYTFFFLLYRKAFKNYIVSLFKKSDQKEVNIVISQIQKMVFKYLKGLFIVILILCLLNGIGLYSIGVKNAIFWGIFSAVLVIIPYVGTFIGAILPFLHVLITGEEWWQPLAVAIMFTVIQFVEGNFITPNIVGSSVKINPLVSIMSVILGSMIWGIGGAILSIPSLAMIRIIFNHIDGFKNTGHLLDSNLYKKNDVFFTSKTTPSEEKHPK